MERIALPLGISRASLMRALKPIFDGQAMSLDLSIGNFDLLGVGTIFDPQGEFGWAPSHEALPAGAARQMPSFLRGST
jgi:hypothetical protein